MSTIKFKAVLRLEKLSKKTNEAPVCLRITKDRKTTYKTLIHVAPEFWNAKRQCVVRHPNADVLNAVISQRRGKIEKDTWMLTLSHEEVSIKTIRNKLNDHLTLDFFDYADRYCRSLMAEKYGTYQRLRSVLNKLHGFVRNAPLPIRDITEDFIRRYEHYLTTVVGNSRNTIVMSMKYIAKILGDIYQTYDLDESSNPFRKIKFHFEPSSRQYLLAEEVAAIRDLDLKQGTPLYNAREIFIFECYSGLRISDILTLSWENVTEEGISIRMRKTGKIISVPLQKNVREMLRQRATEGGHFVFSYLEYLPSAPTSKQEIRAIGIATASINKSLKTIARLAGITKPISTHIGRHSFATMLLSSGIDLPVIQELMGHHDVRVTQIYAKVISRRKAEAIDALNRL